MRESSSERLNDDIDVERDDIVGFCGKSVG